MRLWQAPSCIKQTEINLLFDSPPYFSRSCVCSQKTLSLKERQLHLKGVRVQIGSKLLPMLCHRCLWVCEWSPDEQVASSHVVTDFYLSWSGWSRWLEKHYLNSAYLAFYTTCVCLTKWTFWSGDNNLQSAQLLCFLPRRTKKLSIWLMHYYIRPTGIKLCILSFWTGIENTFVVIKLL